MQHKTEFSRPCPGQHRYEKAPDHAVFARPGDKRIGRGRRTCLGCRLGRAWTQPTGLQAPTTRTAGGPAAAPRCQILPHTNEKSQVPQKRYLTFLAGAEGLEPSARGFGVDVGERTREREKADVIRFPPQVPERAVLVWCCELFLEKDCVSTTTSSFERKAPPPGGWPS